VILRGIVGKDHLRWPYLIDLPGNNLTNLFKALFIDNKTFEIAHLFLYRLLDDLYRFPRQIIIELDWSLIVTVAYFK